jgi:hypothetical protein
MEHDGLSEENEGDPLVVSVSLDGFSGVEPVRTHAWVRHVAFGHQIVVVVFHLELVSTRGTRLFFGTYHGECCGEEAKRVHHMFGDSLVADALDVLADVLSRGDHDGGHEKYQSGHSVVHLEDPVVDVVVLRFDLEVFRYCLERGQHVGNLLSEVENVLQRSEYDFHCFVSATDFVQDGLIEIFGHSD